MNQLGREFWVEKSVIAANKYKFSASRSRQAEQDEAYYNTPETILSRLLALERVMAEEAQEQAGRLT